MAPVIWGLNLGDIQWSKFKSSYMWNTDYHLRRTKFIVYQLAMILCVVSESLGTAALADYVDQQDFILRRSQGKGLEYNDDYIGIGSYNIFAGVFVAFIFGAGFFFDLFWPERYESPSVRQAWKICAVLSSVFVTADVIAMTYIVSTRHAYVTGINAAEATRLLEERHSYNLVYRKNHRALASLIFLWLGWPFVITSTVILWLAKSHDVRLGPLSSHERQNRANALSRSNVNSPGSNLPAESKPEGASFGSSSESNLVVSYEKDHPSHRISGYTSDGVPVVSTGPLGNDNEMNAIRQTNSGTAGQGQSTSPAYV